MDAFLQALDKIMSDEMAIAEVRHNLGSIYDEADEALERQEAEDKADALIVTPEGLQEVDFFGEFSADVHGDLARAFRNLTAAFAGKQYAVDAVLQSVLAIRNRCRDDAIRMVSK